MYLNVNIVDNRMNADGGEKSRSVGKQNPYVGTGI